jgi:lysophospholipase L1-like esterase
MPSLSHSTFHTGAPVRLLNGVLVLGLLLAIGCGGKTPIQPPPPPPPDQLRVSCPAEIVAEATGSAGTDVHFDTPSPTGGRAPVGIECAPGSGSIFPIGETSVRCTAIDADMAQASCGFMIRVRVSQTLFFTKFVAFGDSITDGAISLAPLIMLAGPETYPYKLEQMLLQRYPSQAFTVVNSGKGGEDTREGARRLPSVIEAEKPEVLLLLEGINHINELTNDRQVSALRTMVAEAKDRGVDVIIATVMPVTPAFSQYRSTTVPKIRALNERIFDIANEFSLGNVVDLFALFEANPGLIGRDGVHPTAEGQTRIAEAFRDEIVRRYESRATMTSRLSKLANDAR